MRSPRELYERDLKVEQWEFAVFPDGERYELELIYRAEGLPEDAAGHPADVDALTTADDGEILERACPERRPTVRPCR